MQDTIVSIAVAQVHNSLTLKFQTFYNILKFGRSQDT